MNNLATKAAIKFIKKTSYTISAGRNTLYTRVTEFAFKRYVISSGTRPPKGGFFRLKEFLLMNIFVYSDESGVFDATHNDLFVFGGIIFLDTESKDKNNRKYIQKEL